MKNKNFLESLKNACRGLLQAAKTERNFKVDIFCACLAFLLGIILGFSYLEMGILTVTIFIVLVCELINTAVERTVDLVTEEFRPLAKAAKDIAAGAVLLSSVMSIIVAVLLFLRKSVILKLFSFFNF